jgi:hypothetical protein
MLIPLPFRRLASTGLRRRKAAGCAHHSQSGGTDAGRQRVFAGNAWL